ncbi:MAG: Ig domain-containing protein [Taibaiella sp.]|nr:Ig domain-containing protein [Taibaiella sp.]
MKKRLLMYINSIKSELICLSKMPTCLLVFLLIANSMNSYGGHFWTTPSSSFTFPAGRPYTCEVRIDSFIMGTASEPGYYISAHAIDLEISVDKIHWTNHIEFGMASPPTYNFDTMLYYRFVAPSTPYSGSWGAYILFSASAPPPSAPGWGGGFDVYSPGVYLPPTTNTGPYCAGSTVNLSTTPLDFGSYSWAGPSGFSSTSNSPTIPSASAAVSGVYSVTTTTIGCSATTTTNVTVLSGSPTISGGLNVCEGATTSLSTSGVGGSWSSSDPSVATVGTNGVVTAVSAGTTTISYTLSAGCGSLFDAVVVTVNSAPSAGTISGGTSVCTSATTPLSSTQSGGLWSSSDPSVATVGSATGIVTGVSTGTTTISYSVTGTCGTSVATYAMSVGALTPGISGATGLCIGSTVTMTHPVSGGTWSSSNGGVASVGSTGVVTGVSNGTATITYTASAGCFVTQTITVGLPAIMGTTNVCMGSTTALSNTATGGVWSTAVPYYATVDASTGVVTGVHVGTTMVTYSTGGGCYVTAMIYVPNIALNITGALSLCPGSGTSLSVPGYPGGSWTSSNTSVATIHPTYGGMTGMSPGTTTLTYTYAYCTKTAVATVNGVPAVITADSAVCVGSTISLSCATSGGVWTSSSPTRATVNSSGVVTGVSAGVSTIVYTNGLGCSSTHIVTVGPVPSAISGTTTVCTGSSTTLYCGTASGTWSSSATTVANIVSSTGTSAVLNGVSSGTSTITFHHAGGCEQTTNVTVTPAPAGISGTLDICTGGSSALSATPGGGAWSSSDYARVSVNATTGVITGVSTGTAIITYSSGAACYTTAVATVGVASDITGSSSVCVGLTTTWSHATGGGTWVSSNGGVASVDASTGEITGVSSGSAVITYYIGTGCYAVKSITVYANPPAISGASSLCSGSTITLSNSSGGASAWTSSDVGVATIGSTGVVTGVGAGVTEITYTKTATGCYVTKSITVNETPSPITGATTICVGSDATYVSSPSGGVWSSTAPAVGSIQSSTGIATGRAGGGTTLRYTLSTGCQVAKAVTVTVLPGGISGPSVLCVGNSVLVSAATTGSTWSSSGGSISVSPLGSNTATVSGVSTGTGEVSYTNAAGCSRVYTMTVNAAVAAIGGDDIVCSGGTVTLTNASGGGTWSSNATGRVGIGTYTGIATGGSATGTAIITYRTAAGCYATKTMTNNVALPNIVGATYTCSGPVGVVTFTNSVGGGTWSSSNTSVATVDASTGEVTGVLLGGSNTYVYITYATSAGCSKSKAILIKPQPIISGVGDVAVGATTTLSGSPTGGEWSSASTATAYISGYGVVAGMAAGATTITYTSAGCINTHAMTVTGGSLMRPAGTRVEGERKFNVFPNPTKGAISISTDVAGMFTIYAVDGRAVYVSKLTEGANSVELPVGLASGSYLCRFVGVDESVQAVRLVYKP